MLAFEGLWYRRWLMIWIGLLWVGLHSADHCINEGDASLLKSRPVCLEYLSFTKVEGICIRLI